MPALVVGMMLVLLPFMGRVPVVRRLFGSQPIGVDERSDQGAGCFFNVGMATTSLAHAVSTIKRAIDDCPNDPDDEGKCPLDMTEVFVLFAESASYFATGISECPSIQPTNLMCEARVAKFVSSLGDIAVSGQLIHEECIHVHHKSEPHRRLEAPGMFANLPTNASALPDMLTNAPGMPKNASLIAHCSIKASSAVILFGKAMVDLSKAVRYCPKRNNFEAYRERMECSVALQNAIGALGTVASTLASVALECAESVNVQQKCALDISKLVMSLVEVGASASGVQLHCVWQSHGNKTAQK